MANCRIQYSTYNTLFKKKPPGQTKLKKDGTPRTVAELSAIHGFEKPKVRTVSEILEQTRVIPESAREESRDADKARVTLVLFQKMVVLAKILKLFFQKITKNYFL